METGVIRLRPHHLLCLLAFRGEGYSPEFIERAERLQRALLEDGIVVEVIEGLDDLCTGCPELKDECTSTEEDSGVYRLDCATASFFEIEPGLYEAAELLRIIWDRYSLERGYEICNGCSWLSRTDCPQIIINRFEELNFVGECSDGNVEGG